MGVIFASLWVFGGQEKKRARGKVIKTLTVEKPCGKQSAKKLAGLLRLGNESEKDKDGERVRQKDHLVPIQ